MNPNQRSKNAVLVGGGGGIGQWGILESAKLKEKSSKIAKWPTNLPKTKNRWNGGKWNGHKWDREQTTRTFIRLILSKVFVNVMDLSEAFVTQF